MKDGAPVAPETHVMGEISSSCPDDMVLTIDVKPSILNIFACDRELLTATITGRSSDGDIFFENIPFSPVWKPENSLIADVSPDGWVTGRSEGSVLVKALASAGSAIPPGEALINVHSNIRSFSVTPSSVSLEIDEAAMLVAEIEDAFGNLLDANDVSWSSLDYSVADLQLYKGSFTSVVGVGKGSTTVLAKYEYDCEKLQAEANVTVECPPIEFTIDPDMVTLIGSEVRMLEAVILDEDKNPLDNSSVTWESANLDVVDVTIPEGGYTSVTGVKESPVSIRITATYDDGCQTKEAYAFVKVDCPELTMSLPGASVGVGSSVQLSVESDIPDVDLSKVTWSSSDNLKAFVLPTTGSEVEVYGESPGRAIITATYDDGTCIKTAESAIDVVEGIAGNWNIWPTDQYEEWRYCPPGMCDEWEWYEEDEPDLSSFDVKISQRGGPENYYIEATILGTGGVLTGTWDSKSGYFTLSTNTSDIDQCGYLFYGSDICGDAEDCRLESCKNETYINGYTHESGGKINSLEADSTWYYSVTFSYSTGPESPRGETKWECRGEATQKGERK